MIPSELGVQWPERPRRRRPGRAGQSLWLGAGPEAVCNLAPLHRVDPAIAQRGISGRFDPPRERVAVAEVAAAFLRRAAKANLADNAASRGAEHDYHAGICVGLTRIFSRPAATPTGALEKPSRPLRVEVLCASRNRGARPSATRAGRQGVLFRRYNVVFVGPLTSSARSLGRAPLSRRPVERPTRHPSPP